MNLMETIPDWLAIIGDGKDRGAAEVDLTQLRPQDLLIVTTTHTHYAFTVVSGREANLETNRKDRPSGRVLLAGCTFGDSSSIKPDNLFCGGNLEFTYERDGTRVTHLTTQITALRHLRGKYPGEASTEGTLTRQ
jgi:hypothetical protein